MNTVTQICRFLTEYWQFPALLILIASFISFCIFGIDKWKAQNNRWRISEKALLLSAALFGAIGAYLGMRIFRHKTRHWYFQLLVPLFLLLQVALAATVAVLGHPV